MTDTFTGTHPVTEQDAFDTDRLAVWMTAHVEGFSGTLQIEKFKGGQSNPTLEMAQKNRTGR